MWVGTSLNKVYIYVVCPLAFVNWKEIFPTSGIRIRFTTFNTPHSLQVALPMGLVRPLGDEIQLYSYIAPYG